jgi:hypothetical protein
MQTLTINIAASGTPESTEVHGIGVDFFIF